MLLTVFALVVPFCACHALLLVGRGDACCMAGAWPTSGACGPRAECVAPASHHDACCDSLDSCALGRSELDPGSPEVPQPTIPCPQHRRKPTPTCSRDTCGVKSAPSAEPWQLPSPACIGTVEETGAASGCGTLVRGDAWPPTLPLGQPPTPVEQATLLLV